MYTTHISGLPFKDKRLWSFYLCLYFRLISIELETVPEPYPLDADRSVTPAEGSRWGTSPLQAPKRSPLFFSKLILTPVIRSYLTTEFFSASISERQETKTVISSAYAETYAMWQPEKWIPRKAGFTPNLQAYIAGHRDEGTGGNPAGLTVCSRKIPSVSCSPAPLPGGYGTEW